MTEENELSEPEKSGVEKHLKGKSARSGPSKAEKLDILRRLFRKYSRSALSKWETVEILKRFIRKLSMTETENPPGDIKDK